MNKSNFTKELANKALSYGNPYIQKSIVFQIDRVDHYIFANEIFTKEQLDEEYIKTARHDILAGYKDRMVGYYDKWYRYSHADEGRAYDLGVRFATTQDNCLEEFEIIEQKKKKGKRKMSKEKIKMRVNHDENSTCDLCEEKYKMTLEMYDLMLNGKMFVICKDCMNTLFHKLLKADCLYNGKIKSQADIERKKRHDAKYGCGFGFKEK